MRHPTSDIRHPTSAPPRILLVDDIPEYLEILELYLPDESETVRTTSSAAARAAVESGTFELALIDVRLDEHDSANQEGIELLRWLEGARPNLPVIMISAYQEFELETESLAHGARSFLRKPVDPHELREAVEAALNGKAVRGKAEAGA
jgi:two-component system response regulator PilR (NtrC family)